MDSGGATNPVTRLNRLAACAGLVIPLLLQAQVPFNPSAAPPPGRGRGRGPAASPKQAAPIDMTGYWVSVVTEDWKFRMVTPPKGNYAGVPLNAAGRKVADTWDAAKDEAAGNQCRSYGAAGLMRVPGRLHISWENDTTLRVDTDSGTQTRLLHFGGTPSQNQPPEWQGYSAASWDGLRPRPQGAAAFQGAPLPEGYLKVVTTDMKPGYLR